MNRTTLDRLLASGGLVVAAVLLVAGALLTWAHVFITDQVHSQLSAQKIYFPPKGSPELASPQIGPYLNKYAGQQLVNGDQARAYADHFIAVHLQEMTGGKTYAQLSAQLLQEKKPDPKLVHLVDTVFRGQTLRGLLLTSYAFDTVGGIALIAAIVAYVGALLMLVLAALGYRHAHQVDRGAPPPHMPERQRIVA